MWNACPCRFFPKSQGCFPSFLPHSFSSRLHLKLHGTGSVSSMTHPNPARCHGPTPLEKLNPLSFGSLVGKPSRRWIPSRVSFLGAQLPGLVLILICLLSEETSAGRFATLNWSIVFAVEARTYAHLPRGGIKDGVSLHPQVVQHTVIPVVRVQVRSASRSPLNMSENRRYGHVMCRTSQIWSYARSRRGASIK